MPPDLHDRILSALLALTGGALSIFLVLAPLAGLQVALGNTPLQPGEGPIFAIVLPFSFLLGLFGALSLAAGIQLWRDRRLGWILGLVCCGLWATGGLLPLSVYGLWVLLRLRTRSRHAAAA